MDMTDEQLAQQSAIGDDDAFKELVHRFLPAIFNFVRGYVHSSEDAEDVAQDTFFKAWKNIRKYKTSKSFRPWIYTIARNTALDFLKKKKAITFTDMSDDDSVPFADTIEDTEALQHELFERAEYATELAEIMEDFHPDHRSVLTLYYQEEMTFSEIAETLNKSINTVKSWHRRSLLKIREIMHQKRP